MNNEGTIEAIRWTNAYRAADEIMRQLPADLSDRKAVEMRLAEAIKDLKDGGKL